jgi:hypothetical protein
MSLYYTKIHHTNTFVGRVVDCNANMFGVWGSILTVCLCNNCLHITRLGFRFSNSLAQIFLQWIFINREFDYVIILAFFTKKEKKLTKPHDIWNILYCIVNM